MAEDIIALGAKKKSTWVHICTPLGVLSPNERVYLGADLKDVLVFHPATEM